MWIEPSNLSAKRITVALLFKLEEKPLSEVLRGTMPTCERPAGFVMTMTTAFRHIVFRRVVTGLTQLFIGDG